VLYLQKIIQCFGYTNLFPRGKLKIAPRVLKLDILEAYEFYARITGRTLRIDADEEYQFRFIYPSSKCIFVLKFTNGSPPPQEFTNFVKNLNILDKIERLLSIGLGISIYTK
jgi:hypothetical protein